MGYLSVAHGKMWSICSALFPAISQERFFFVFQYQRSKKIDFYSFSSIISKANIHVHENMSFYCNLILPNLLFTASVLAASYGGRFCV